MNTELLNNLKRVFSELVIDTEIEVIDVDFVKDSGKHILRVTADTQNGIGIDEITELTNKINAYLDQDDPIDGEYFLEVTSPGAERELKQVSEIIQSIGKYVNVRTYEKIDGIKEFEGFLLDADDDTVLVQINIKGRLKQIKIKHKQISKIRWAIKL